MADLAVIGPVAFVGAALGFAGNVIVQALKSGGERKKAQVDATTRLEEHRDNLAIEMLTAARAELAATRAELATQRQENAALRPALARMEAALAHFEEALEFVDRLLTSGTPEERAATERQARAFLNRMRRVQDAHGTMANEAQIERSAASVPADMQGALKKLP